MAFREIGPGTLLSPTPVVMVSCADQKLRPNIITVAWAGTVCSDPPMVSVSIRPERYSYGLILDSKEFVVNLVSLSLLSACDYCGVKSGRDEDKFAACRLTAEAVPGLRHAPAIAQSPLYLACRLEQVIALGSHAMFVGEVVSVGAQDRILMPDGRLALDQADLVAYAHGRYYGLGEMEGFFGYSVARPEVLRRRMPHKREG